MAPIYVVRHGETDDNRNNIVLGQSNPSLSSTGRKQAEAVAKFLAQRSLSKIISSDLKRSAETAQIIAEMTGRGIELDHRLREADFGVLEGKLIDELLQAGIWQVRRKNMYSFRPARGESYQQVESRVTEFLEARLDTLNEAVIATHVGVIRVLAVLAKHCARAEVSNLDPRNGSCWRIDIAGRKLSNFRGLFGTSP